MILTDAYFENIQATIQRELLMAKRTVYAAIAWFTDETLFNTLLQIQEQNVQVHLCIIKDDINFRVNGLLFEKLGTYNSTFFAIQGDKMHHKFCVIDESVVITGSYNWTYKAANAGKDENIIVTSGDYELAQKFIQEFLKITGQEHTNANANIERVLKRCKAILNLLQLDEVEDVHKQAKRLQTEASSLQAVYTLTQHLLQNRFTQAIEEINVLLNKYQALQVFEDPLINALKLEIKLLEYQVIALENEKADAENKIFEYDRLFNEILGETVRKYLELKKNLKQQAKEENPQSETAYRQFEEAEADYRAFKESYEETAEQVKGFMEIDNPEEVVALKKLYREAAVLCHPDKFINEIEKQQKAEKLFIDLSDAYQKQDIEKVKDILYHLKQGILNIRETNTQTDDLQILKHILQQLQNKCAELMSVIKSIKDSEAYKVIENEDDLQHYFINMKNDIEQQIAELQKQVMAYEQQSVD